MAAERFEVQNARPERRYAKVYHDFLRTKNLTTEEKMVYIALKSFINFKEDEGKVFPSMETLCQLTSMSRPRATRAITSLIRKGVVKKKRQGLTKTNIYTLNDNSALWAAETVEEMHKVAESSIPYTSQEMLEELKRRGVISDKVIEILTKKEPSSGTDQSSDESTSSNLSVVSTTNNSTVRQSESQERYTMEDIRMLYDYSILVGDKQLDVNDVDAVMDILYDVLNTTKKTIRVAKENKPTMVVIGKFLRLTAEEIRYSIQKYNGIAEKISNPKAYMLTILYSAREQLSLEITNQVRHDFYENRMTDDTE